jgi:hypothetical protein
VTEQSQWVSDDANQSILQGAQDFIRQHITNLYDHQRAQEIEREILKTRDQIEHQYSSWIDDKPSKFHLRFMSLLLASYRTLLELMTREEALDLVKKAVIEPNRQAIGEGVRYALDAASDPMSVLVNASREREEYFFGRTFTFDRYQDDEQAYILHVKRCFYHQFAVVNEAPELMQVLCEWDWIWAKAIEPSRHDFSFELPTTLGYGGDMCRFCFRRLTR